MNLSECMNAFPTKHPVKHQFAGRIFMVFPMVSGCAVYIIDKKVDITMKIRRKIDFFEAICYNIVVRGKF